MANPLSREAGDLKRSAKRVFVARGAFSLRAPASLDRPLVQLDTGPVNRNRPTRRVTLRTARRGRAAAPGRLGGTGLRPVVAFHTTLTASAAQGGVARAV